MKIDAVVVIYNAEYSVISNIKSYINFVNNLYIIDNSEDINLNLRKRIEEISNKCIYIDNNGNQGIANALNLGAKLAIGNGAEWLLTMDQDTSFNNDDFEKLVNIASNKNINDAIAIISPSHYKYEKDLYAFYDTIAMTSGNLIKLNIFKKLNGFDEKLFIDSVDIDYCLRVFSNNYLVERVPSIVLNHTLGDIKTYKLFGLTFNPTNHSYIRRYYIMRNRLYIWSKYKDIHPSYVRFEKLITVREFLKIILFENDKLRKIQYMGKGYLDFKKRKFGKYLRFD